ncbi:lipopolysaccharide biosynthesis protein [Streptomyces calvus]
MTDTPTRRLRTTLDRVRTLPAWSALVAGTLAGGLCGGAYGLLTPAQYAATGYVVAVPAENATPEAARGFAQAYGRVATQLAVLGDAQVWAGVPVRTLRDSVRTATSPDAPMVSVTATSTDPELAVDMANAVTRALTRHAEDTRGSTQVRLVQFSRAVKPGEPASASSTTTALVGAGAGGLLGGLALLARPGRPGRDEDPVPAASVPGPAAAADVQR